MMAASQGHLIAVETKLGAGMLLVDRMEGTEAVSEPFRIELEMLSRDASIDSVALLGTAATVTVRTPESAEEERIFHGVISRFVQYGQRDTMAVYRAELVPWLWMLSLSSDCRIFQNRTAIEIVEEVLEAAEINGLEYRIKKVGDVPPKREFCVQYRETNLNFITRLLAEEGYFYFFEHTRSGHTLVIANHSSAVEPCPGAAMVPMSPTVRGGYLDEPVVFQLVREHQMISGAVALADFNFEASQTPMLAQVSGKQKGEIYDYPGGFSQQQDGHRYARLRLEAQEATQQVVRGESNAWHLRSGCRFKLTDHYRGDVNQEYQLLRVRHVASNGGYTSGQEEPPQYENTFVAIPHSVPYRPLDTTPKPVVRGSQTAVVVGPKDEEIHTDRLGSVKVQFHWDRQGKKDANSSCWVRVSSSWAGKGWGMIAIPRVGEEVIVDFLEGDPDRPLVTGRVYNGVQMPPYALPANQTQSGIKTRSSKNGSAATFNELRFEDKKDAEQVYLHAEKDLHIVVENDAVMEIGTGKKDPGKQTITVYGDQSTTISSGNQVVDIAKGDQTVTLTKGSHTLKLEAGQSTTDAKKSIELKVGGNSIKIDAQGITLNVGGNSIKVDTQGITLKGMSIKIEGDQSTQVKGSMVQVDASAMVMIKGSAVKIN